MSRTNGSRVRSNGGTSATVRGSRVAKRRPREDTSHPALMVALRDEQRTRTLFTKLSFMARARYGLRPDDSEDVFHEAVATYLTIHARYPSGDNHFGLLVGIFHKKALEHLGARQRTGAPAAWLADLSRGCAATGRTWPAARTRRARPCSASSGTRTRS